MSRIEVTTRESIEQGAFVLNAVVDHADGVDAEVFVLRDDDSSFSHVATLRDLANYPNSLSEARALGQPFYRAASMCARFVSASDAREASVQLGVRLARLVRDWNATQPPNFGVTTTTVYG